jgi:Family of unknown function (DUF6074)
MNLDAGMQSAQVVVFPLSARVGKARDVAAKLRIKRTDRHRKSYPALVTHSLRHSMARHGASAAMIQEELMLFWCRVSDELARQEMSPNSAVVR